MTDVCLTCGKWFNAHKVEKEIVIEDDSIMLIYPVFCPHCGDKGINVYHYAYTSIIDKIIYKDLDKFTKSHKVSSQVLHGLVGREVKELRRLNPATPLNLLEQLEQLEEQ